MSAKKGYSSEAIIRALRQAEVMLHESKSIAEACRSLGISDSTYYKWRKEYGGMQIAQAKRLKELEREKSRLKKAVADLIDSPGGSPGKVACPKRRLFYVTNAMQRYSVSERHACSALSYAQKLVMVSL